jgi:peptide/nickel transport system substrate-binding protein
MPAGSGNPMCVHWSRRRALTAAGASGLSLVAAAVAGCSQGHKPTTATSGQPSGQARRGGTLTYAGGRAGSNDTTGRTFDPAIQTQWSDKSFLLFYERLLAYNPRTYQVEPELAQKWEQPSATEYVFHLQPNVKWQNKPPLNGRALTADDLVYNLTRAGANNPRLYSRSMLALMDKVDSPDQATVRLTTKSADASTLTKLSSELLETVAREVVEKYSKLTTADSAVGTGPFVMQSEEDNVSAEYVRNSSYWRPSLPYLDDFRTKAFSDSLTAWAAFQSGQVDVVIVPASEIQKYLAQQGRGYTPDWFADDTTYSCLTPNTKQKPMDDTRVTRALRLLIDHDEFVHAWAETQYGRGTYGSIFPTALSAWDLTEAEYRQHLEWKQPKDEAAKEANSLLAAAGFTKDSPLRFTLVLPQGSQQAAAAQLTQAQWKRLSQGAVDVQIQPLQPAAMDADRAQGTFTYGHFGFSAGMADPDAWLTSAYYTGGSLNFARFSDPQVDAMIDKQRTIFDQNQRKASIKQIVLYMIDDAPTTIGANLYWLQAAKPKARNFIPCNTLNGYVYRTLWFSA